MAGIFDFLTGTNPNQGAINNAQNSAAQATQAENQLIQSTLVPIINTMLSNWNNYYQPQVANAATQVGAIQPNTAATGANTLDFFNNEMNQGLTPQSIGAAQNTYDVGQQQMLNSIANRLGPATPNLAGTIQNLNQQDLQGRIGLASSLAGMNQNFQNQGAQSGMNTSQGLLNDIMSFIQQGGGFLTGAQGATQNLTGMYGNAANTAANNAMNLANAGNQANSSTMNGLAGVAGALAGAGVFG
ncbi:MAG: hypothetical protein KGL39_36595 [Patescibacteria group bacterium]|nr:hypothetical protein [Patescibacteria group bacterium]